MLDAKVTLLIVDNDPSIRYSLCQIFSCMGHTVRMAEDGFSALRQIGETIPDILLSDLNMPRMSGFELLSIVRRRFPTIAVIAMSGAYSDAVVPQGVPADAFYAKGASSVAQLFEILCAIKDEATRHSTRAASPIWVPALPIDQGDLSNMAIPCPECLRTFTHPLHDAEFSREERCCPHCLHPVQLAIVKPSAGTDKTRLAISEIVDRDHTVALMR